MLATGQIKYAKPGLHADGGGLYLSVKPSGGKSWILRYQVNGKRRKLGLGSLDKVTPTDARAAAEAALKSAKAGVDVIAQKRAEKAAAADKAQAESKVPYKTFSMVAAEYIEIKRDGWKNLKHRQQWVNTLATHAKTISNMAPADITSEDVLKILKPLWLKHHETATRLRNRIHAVLEHAVSLKLRDENHRNPARFEGFLETHLPAYNKPAKHFAAMPYKDVSKFMKALALVPGDSARCLEFTILTACRSGESLGARWSEIDMDAKLWTIPASRMKGKEDHRIPLSDAALKVLAQQDGKHKHLVFIGRVSKKQMTDMALTMVMRRHHREYTTHGFRSSFRVWAAETTSYQHEVCEMALDHKPRNKVVKAYMRTDFLEKRIPLMNDWAAYIGRPAPKCAENTTDKMSK